MAMNGVRTTPPWSLPLGLAQIKIDGEDNPRRADLPARVRDTATAGARAPPARSLARALRRRARGAGRTALPRQVGVEGCVSVRAAAGAARGVRPDPRLLGYAREGDDRRLHPRRPRG